MDDERRWEELNVDCLVNIFGRVGMESLLLDIPFVCKPWHQASLNPSCWESLVFPELTNPNTYDDEYTYSCFDKFSYVYEFDGIHVSVDAFVKFVIDRSKGRTTLLELSPCASEDVLKYAADQCPHLKALSLPSDLIDNESRIIKELIGKWKHLESLVLGNSDKLEKFLTHCKNLRFLHVENASVGEKEAKAIVTFLPELKKLILKGASINRDEVVTLLHGCKELRPHHLAPLKELVHLDVSNCEGFDGKDEEIAKLASHIANFTSEGSYVDDDDYDHEFGPGDWDQFGGYGSD
ncbi:F-box/LRR-repeat protein At3g48880-like [Argentina anserina]|uniref:F-box/LRR-repeat protein At3g48880-like n=1 Tax=Argentina anserina TaxID=57926 RepID=UPI0021762918|nr:F-box/LRR-repeat protein At3g48880-like [Potentilla anserina]